MFCCNNTDVKSTLLVSKSATRSNPGISGALQLAEFSKKDDRGLVKALFETFPPKHRTEESWRNLLPEEKEDGDIGWKNLFKKLVVIYHPDRVDKAKLGEKYHVLCEEITSELNKRYSKYKC